MKQIVGGSLRDDSSQLPKVNFVSEKPPSWFAERFRNDQVSGGHVIMLGPGNDAGAREALATWPGGLQVGGGIRSDNAEEWLQAGASHVIVTSFLFNDQGQFLTHRLDELIGSVGVDRVVIDLSCRRVNGEPRWFVAMNRWQIITELELNVSLLESLESSCAEFLIHAADVEGLCRGIDEDLVKMLGGYDGNPVTYAGGARSIDDLAKVGQVSGGRVDLTIGSALDLFGGAVSYEECVALNRAVVPGSE